MTIILLYTLSSIWAYPSTGLDEKKAACTGAHQKWDDSLNRCMVTQGAVDMKGNTDACAGSADPESCYMKVAEKETGVQEGDKLESKNIELVAKVVAGAYAIFSFIAGSAAFERYTKAGEKAMKGTGVKKGCKSKTAFQLTSVAWIGGDLFLKHRAKKNFEKMAEDYKSEANNENLKGSADSSFQAQTRAFTYLRQEQEQIKEQADMRVKLQMVAALGFGVTAGLATYELFNPLAACGSTGEKGEPDAADSDATGTETAEAPDTPADSTGAEAGSAGKDVAKDAAQGLDPKQKAAASFMAKLHSSPTILTGALVMMAINLYLIHHAKAEKGRAEKNIAMIDEALETYSQFMAGFCPDGREDINNDRCYCYNPDGTKNENRTKSVICQNLFAADDINYSLKTAKIKPIDEGPRQGCITVTGQFDVDCKCQKMINTTSKQNACMNSPNSGLFTGGFGAQLDAPSTISTLGSMGNGANKALGSLNGADLAKKVARNKKLLDSLTAQAKAKDPKAKTTKEMEGIAKDLLKGSTSPASLSRMNNAFSPTGRGLGSVPQGLDSALKKVESKVNLDKSPSLVMAKSGKGTVGANSGKGSDFKFKWNDTAAREGNQVKSFMAKDYDYKGSDIVDNDNVSLWNVISKRYQTSGLKRLFGEEEEE